MRGRRLSIRPSAAAEAQARRRRLRERFAAEAEFGSPVGGAPPWLPSELYMRLRRRD